MKVIHAALVTVGFASCAFCCSCGRLCFISCAFCCACSLIACGSVVPSTEPTACCAPPIMLKAPPASEPTPLAAR
jgi:hypothetical protein